MAIVLDENLPLNPDQLGLSILCDGADCGIRFEMAGVTLAELQTAADKAGWRREKLHPHVNFCPQCL